MANTARPPLAGRPPRDVWAYQCIVALGLRSPAVQTLYALCASADSDSLDTTIGTHKLAQRAGVSVNTATEGLRILSGKPTRSHPGPNYKLIDRDARYRRSTVTTLLVAECGFTRVVNPLGKTVWWLPLSGIPTVGNPSIPENGDSEHSQDPPVSPKTGKVDSQPTRVDSQPAGSHIPSVIPSEGVHSLSHSASVGTSACPDDRRAPERHGDSFQHDLFDQEER